MPPSQTLAHKPITKVQKRDGTILPYNIEKVESAVFKAMLSTSVEGSYEDAQKVARLVNADLERIAKRYKNFLPTVEGIQDTVEEVLIREDYAKTAKNYILYREERARLRAQGLTVPPKLRELSDESRTYFKNPLGEFIYYRTYARWMESEGRRETWIETVDRYMAFMKENLGKKLRPQEFDDVRTAILKMEAMPSMRLLQFAGNAARNTNVCAYNCSYIAPKSIEDLAEIMYISMCGTGAGFSIESKYAQAFPQIKTQKGKKVNTHIVADSKEGWCAALIAGLSAWYDGHDIDFDYLLFFLSGSRLKTMGFNSSGLELLCLLFNFSRDRILRHQGRRLSNLDLHDIICKIGDCVVAGGVRRSALISLSDLDDSDIRDAKKGQFYMTDPQRMLANNSAVYEHKPSATEFLEEWISLMKSGSGERGIFNRGSLAATLPKRRIDILGGDTSNLGTNPCGEIILQSKQFCNLSEIVARSNHTLPTLKRKMRIAAILGTYQSTLTNFPYLSKEWKENCERERLLGISITGQWDCPAVRKASSLRALRDEAIKINKQYARRFGVNASSAITCVKPSGTLSQLVDCASGMHARHSKYYIRRVRIAATDSLFKMLRDQGVPFHPEVGQSAEDATTFVLEFPVKAPDNSLFRDDITALKQLEHWKLVKENYTEHNPSVTISVGEDEWLAVGNWVFENWGIVGGLSFLPRDNHVYQLAPYEAIDEKTYTELAQRFEHIDYSKIITYEKIDETEQKRELACAGGTCEI